MKLVIEVEDGNNIFALTDNGHTMAKMYYYQPVPDRIVIQHTEVDHAQKGKGVGRKLFYYVVEFAKQHHLKIVPKCAFVHKMFEKHPELKDML